MDYSNYLKIAKDASIEVGDYLLKNFGSNKIATHKSGTHYGIAEDLIANNIYTTSFKKLTPEISLYTEENERNLTDLTWIVDSIEGTSNYRVGNPFFATQVCLLENKKPIVSVIFAPYLKQMFTSISGQGVYLNDQKISPIITNDIDKSLISFNKGTSHDDLVWVGETVKKIIHKIRTIRMYGVTGLDLAYVASGMIDVNINKGSQIYDYAPGVLLVRESGGVVLNENGKDWEIEDKFVVASLNSKLALEVLKIIKS